MEAAAPGMDFAERLGLWLNAFDAIKLQGSLQTIRAISAPAPVRGRGARPATALELREQLQRVRAALAHAMAQDPRSLPVPKPAQAVRLPAGAPASALAAALLAEPDEAAAPAYGPFQHRHLDLQRHMEQMIGPLRDDARQALAQSSPRLRQLATLDAVLQDALAVREQQLLAAVPVLLARRFEQRRQMHAQDQHALALDAVDDAPESAADEHGWLADFAADWREALLAELDLRLEPVIGLIEALNNEVKS